jgi:hypothetical protein
MTLRDHPLMTYHGATSWPPVWCRTGEQPLTGEIGVLVSVDCDRTGNRCYLGMEIDDRRYLGTLMVNDVAFCWLVTKILKNRTGMSIKDIGDLDLSFAL